MSELCNWLSNQQYATNNATRPSKGHLINRQRQRKWALYDRAEDSGTTSSAVDRACQKGLRKFPTTFKTNSHPRKPQLLLSLRPLACRPQAASHPWSLARGCNHLPISTSIQLITSKMTSFRVTENVEYYTCKNKNPHQVESPPPHQQASNYICTAKEAATRRRRRPQQPRGLYLAVS